MSRIGKLPIQIPSGVTITVDSDFVTVSSSKGTLQQFMMPGIDVTVDGNVVTVTRQSEEREHRSKHGLMRTLVSNMVVGITDGFTKQLEINGVGFRAAVQGSVIKMQLGFSHEVVYNLPQGVSAVMEQNIMTISGINKQQVGQVAAEIRALKKPEPYKGKGIKYVTERIVRKSGKSGKDKQVSSMSELTRKKLNRAQRAHRVRATVHGSLERPRLVLRITNMHISAQVVNDDAQKTLASATTVGSKKATGTMTEKAAVLGAEIAKKAKAAKVTAVVLDRGSRLYHGRVKAFADAARKEGLEF